MTRSHRHMMKKGQRTWYPSDLYRVQVTISIVLDKKGNPIGPRKRTGTVKTIRATRVELEREKRATLEQIDNEMGKVIKLEHSGPGGGPIMVVEIDNRTMVVPEANGNGEG